jgi:GH3 auxin-responsive promoter
MGLILKAAAFITGRRWAAWNALTIQPQEVQNRLLLEIIRRNCSTRFGRDHRLDTIRSLSDYRKQVDIGDYERLRPYVELAKKGEANALTEEPVLMFTQTSGSTGEPKLIPITESARNNYRLLTRFWYYRAYVDHPGCLSGKLLGIVSPAVEGRTLGGIPFGAASGLIYESSPGWLQNSFVVPYETSQIKDSAAKYYIVMRLALEHEISFFGTPNPSTILKLIESADQFKAEIIKDIRDGTIAARWELPAVIRHQLVSKLKKNVARARQLEDFATQHEKLRPREYWPQLQLIGCWKGGTVGIRLKQFSRWFAEDTPVRDLGYMASEAQITLPISDAGSAGILSIDANFYEFIPVGEIGGSNPKTLTCTELDQGQSYYIVLTTAGGLYRYDINDVVRVSGFYNQTPLIEFVRKGRDVTNITGEKLHVNQVIQAMDQAQSASCVVVQHYQAFADLEKSRYTFLLGIDGAIPSKETLMCLLNDLDTSLHHLNIEYAQKRESGRLGAPVLWVMKSGWFDRKATSTLQRAGRDVQFKARLLSAVAEDSSEALLIVEKPDVSATSEKPA